MAAVVNPFFTIVTISFNQASFVEETIVSILSQSLADFEYIISDGGSTDGSLDIINRYSSDPRVRLFIGQDSGPADALKKAFSHARGQFFVYINSDDVLLPSSLERMKDAVSLYPDRVICGSGVFVDDRSRPLFKTYSDRFIKLFAVFGHCFVLQPSTIIPAKLYMKTKGFNVSNRCNWDHELLLDLHSSGARFVSLSDCWSTYRLHSTSITSTMKLAHLHRAYRLSVIKSAYPFIAKYKLVEVLAELLLWILSKLVYPMKTLRALSWRLSRNSKDHKS